MRRFVDSWGPNDEPVDINDDLYCKKCDIRWLEEDGPHEFFNQQESKR